MVCVRMSGRWTENHTIRNVRSWFVGRNRNDTCWYATTSYQLNNFNTLTSHTTHYNSLAVPTPPNALNFYWIVIVAWKFIKTEAAADRGGHRCSHEFGCYGRSIWLDVKIVPYPGSLITRYRSIMSSQLHNNSSIIQVADSRHKQCTLSIDTATIFILTRYWYT